LLLEYRLVHSILFALWTTLLAADGASQAEQLLKVVAHDRNLEARTPEGLRLAALHDPGDDASRLDAERFVSEVTSILREGANVRLQTVENVPFTNQAELYSFLVTKKISAVYVAPGLSDVLPEVTRASEDAGVMTLAGAIADVERGLAVGLGDGRKIVVNIGAAERCGVDLDPAVRQVARRVGETSPDPERGRLAETLSRYRNAIETKDIDALRALWPDLSGQEAEKVQASMNGVKAHDVSVALLRIEPDGARIRVRVRRSDRLLTREGKTLVSGRLMEIYFRRSEAGAWVIESMAGVGGA
jgi:hypothetical protein